MSCVSVKIGKPGIGFVQIISPSVGNVETNTLPVGGCSFNVLNSSIISTTKVGNLKLNIYLICRTNKGVYLRVTPTETMYIWVIGDSIDYNVRSNTNWIVQ